jgi:ABC-2 type transport system ATP-binding protein
MSEPLLRADDVWKYRAGRCVLAGIALEVAAGERVAIGGENGAGKSTLLCVLAGLFAPDRGRVERATATGYCPQEPALYAYLTPREHFALFGAALGLPRAVIAERGEALLSRFGFARYGDRPAEALSGGTRQKLNLSLALLSEPPVLLLDEPQGGFDLETHRRFEAWSEEARAAGQCVLAVTHAPPERGAHDRCFELRQGVLHGLG